MRGVYKIENCNIPFEEARKRVEYKFHKSDNVCTRDSLVKFLKKICSSKEDETHIAMDFDMYFGSLSVESEISYDYTENKFLIAGFVYADYEGDGWGSEGYTNDIAYGKADEIEQIITEDLYNGIEQKMYNGLMEFAKENKLYWNKLNTDEQFFDMAR